MGSRASIELFVCNWKLFKKRGVMNPFPSSVTLQKEALPEWYHRLDSEVPHNRTNEREGTSDYNIL
jgi:hypothetical protein